MIVAVGTFAGFAHTDVWGSRTRATVLLVLLLAVPVTASFIRKGSISLAASGDIPAVVSSFIVTAVGAVTVLVLPFQVWSRAGSISSDFTRHLIFVGNTVGNGNLNYEIENRDDAYPRAAHALVGLLWRVTGGNGYISVWKTAQVTMWMMLILIFFCLTLTSVKLAKQVGLPSLAANVVVPGVMMLVLFQGSWVAMFNQGFVNSVFAGAVLSCLFAYGATSRWRGTLTSVILSLACVILIANSWILLNTIVGCVLVTAIIFWVRKKPSKTEWFIAAGATILTVVCSLPVVLSTLNVSQDAETLEAAQRTGMFAVFAIGGSSGLATPSLWWIAAVCTGGVTAIFMFMRVRVLVDNVAWFTLIVAPGLLFTFFLFTVTGSSWDSIKYYPLKTLWTVLPLFLPFTAVGVLWGCNIAYTRFTANRVQVTVRGGKVGVGVLTVAGCCLAAIVGVTVLRTSLLFTELDATSGRAGTNIVIPVMEVLETRNGDGGVSGGGGKNQTVIVYGLLPYSSESRMESSTTHLYDVVAERATGWLGYRTTSMSGPKIVANEKKNFAKMCDVLKENPDALYVTGPNPQSGPQRLLDAGCPEQTVQPDKWIVVPISDEWYKNTEWYRKPYVYPGIKK